MTDAADRRPWLDATTKRGLVAAALLSVAVTVAWTFIHAKQLEERKAIQDRTDELKAFLARVGGRSWTWGGEWDRAALIDENADSGVRWRGSPIEPEIVRVRAGLPRRVATSGPKRPPVPPPLAGPEPSEAIGGLSCQDLRDLRSALVQFHRDDVIADGRSAKDWIAEVDRRFVPKVVDEAVALAKSHPDGTALARFAAAEDDVLSAIERATIARHEADADAFRRFYGAALLPASDDLAEAVLTPAFADSIRWRNLLAGEGAGTWSASHEVPGFSFAAERGVVTICRADEGPYSQAFAGIRDATGDRWRNVLVDMEFSIDGEATMYFHAPPPPGWPNCQQSETCQLGSKSQGRSAKETQELTASYIGSRFVVCIDGCAIPRAQSAPSPAKRRWGGIAFDLRPGARLTITRLRIKVLR